MEDGHFSKISTLLNIVKNITLSSAW